MVKIHLIGNVTSDATVKLINNKQVINFSICVNEGYKNNSGEKHEKKYYFSCSLWHNSTTLPQYIKKGQLVYIEGNEVTANGYQNSNREISASVDVRVTTLKLLGSPKNSDENNFAEAGFDNLPY